MRSNELRFPESARAAASPGAERHADRAEARDRSPCEWSEFRRRWRNLVGKDIADRARPKHLSPSGALIVVVDDEYPDHQVWRMDLTRRSDEILNMLPTKVDGIALSCVLVL